MRHDERGDGVRVERRPICIIKFSILLIENPHVMEETESEIQAETEELQHVLEARSRGWSKCLALDHIHGVFDEVLVDVLGTAVVVTQ